MDHAQRTAKSNHEQDKSPHKEKMEEHPSAHKKAEHKEGPVARAIENRTAKLPSDLFLWMAGAAVVGSATLKVVELVKASPKERRGTLSVFIGMWAPTFLLLGLYNKLVKVAGSEQAPQAS